MRRKMSHISAMKRTGCLLIVALAFLASRAIGAAAEPVLGISGEIKEPLKLSLADLKAMPLVKVRATDRDGHAAEYEGVSLGEILRRAGAPEGDALRGEALRLCVLVKAADGYQVAFSLAELDPNFTDKQVVLVFRKDGKELDAETGPLRIVVPDEKRHGRWVRQVTGLEIIRLGGGAKPS
jgi:DMSO/TMAO reductase YedYZ molybdopterin-dependent catalytic subunit